jgi:hypothetical protein
MVGNVQCLPRPRVGLQGSLDERYEAARERVLHRIPAGHPLRTAANGMKSEIAIDQMDDAIAAYEQARPVAGTRNPMVILLSNQSAAIGRRN